MTEIKTVLMSSLSQTGQRPAINCKAVYLSFPVIGLKNGATAYDQQEKPQAL